MFSIDIVAYAVMSNYVHVVLSVDIYQANMLSDKEVVERWHRLFKGTDITQKFVKGEIIESVEIAQLKHSIADYRCRLGDIS